MGTRAQAFTAKIKNLQELQLRLIQEKYSITDTFQKYSSGNIWTWYNCIMYNHFDIIYEWY